MGGAWLLLSSFVGGLAFPSGQGPPQLAAPQPAWHAGPGPSTQYAPQHQHQPPPLVDKTKPASPAARARPQYPRPHFIGADLSKVGLADALAPSDFDRSRRTLYLIEVGGGVARSNLARG
jgi:hypothetical protein